MSDLLAALRRIASQAKAALHGWLPGPTPALIPVRAQAGRSPARGRRS